MTFTITNPRHTTRKQVEDALQESEKRLRSVLNSSPDVIYSLDLRSGQTNFLNRQEILGYPRDEFHTFGHVLSAVHPDDRQTVEQYWFELLECRDAETKNLEVRLRHREGNWVWFQMRSTVSSRDGEMISEVMITLTDISERRLIEQQLEDYRFRLEELVTERTSQLNRARERVESILNSSTDAIVLASAEGTIQQTNPEFNLTFSCDIDAYFDRPLSALVDADSAPLLMDALRTTLEEREGQRLEVVAIRRDGSRFDADVVVSAVAPSKRAEPSGIVCQFRDITQRKQTEAELRKALERERELGELKSRFVSMASHEFRTPLATIMATADTLRNYLDRLQPEEIERRFDKIQVEVRHMTSLIEEVLLVGSAEAGRVDFRPEVFDVVDFSQDILERLERTDHGEHGLTFQPEGMFTTVHADLRLLRQIITNLLSNALKYSPAGSPVAVRLDCTTPDLFVLQVADHGVGIPPADQQHLFEAFHRATNVGTIPGTGLGMNITQHAVALHNGTITFESAENVGTTFCVRIPYTLPAEAEEPSSDEGSGH
jgi:PAS domain S-box-containing protein